MTFYTDENAILLLLSKIHNCGYDRTKIINHLNAQPLPVNFVCFESVGAYKMLLKHIFNENESFGFNSVFHLIHQKYPLKVWEQLLFRVQSKLTMLSDLFPIEPNSRCRKFESEAIKGFDLEGHRYVERYMYEQGLDIDLKYLYNMAYIDKVSEIARRKPDEGSRGVAKGFLVIQTALDGGEKYRCLCRSCGKIVTVAKDAMSRNACSSCVEKYGLDAFTQAEQIAYVKSVTASRQDTIRRDGAEWAKQNLVALLDEQGIGHFKPEEGRAKFAAHAQIIKGGQNKYMKSRWKLNASKLEAHLDTPLILLRWAGYPLTPTDELHRLNHNDDAWTNQTPYSHESVIWLSKATNKALKRTNTSIEFNDVVYPSLESACAAANVKPGTLRQRIRRDKSRTPQEHFDLMFEAPESDIMGV